MKSIDEVNRLLVQNETKIKEWETTYSFEDAVPGYMDCGKYAGLIAYEDYLTALLDKLVEANLAEEHKVAVKEKFANRMPREKQTQKPGTGRTMRGGGTDDIVIVSIILIMVSALLGHYFGRSGGIEYQKQQYVAEAVESETVRYTVTAYCPCEKCCGRWADGVTADGTKAEGKIIASDLPFGTWIGVPGYGWAEVHDRGVKGNRIDVLFPTHDAALQWGVQELDCEVRR